MDQFCVIRIPVCELLDWMSGPGVRGGDLGGPAAKSMGGSILGRHRLGLPGDGRSGPFICVVPVPVLPHVGHSVLLSLTSR